MGVFLSPSLAEKKETAVKEIIGQAIALDAETIQVFTEKRKFKIKLYGLVSPKFQSDRGYWARAALDNLLQDQKSVACIREFANKYKKIPKNHYQCFANGQEIALKIIASGYGFSDRRFLSLDNYRPYLQAELHAKTQKLGFWADQWQKPDLQK